MVLNEKQQNAVLFFGIRCLHQPFMQYLPDQQIS